MASLVLVLSAPPPSSPPLPPLSLPVTSRLRPCAIPHPDPDPLSHPHPLHSPTLINLSPTALFYPLHICHIHTHIHIHTSHPYLPRPSPIHPSSSSPSLFLVKRSSPAPKGKRKQSNGDKETRTPREHCSHIFQALNPQSTHRIKIIHCSQFIPHIFSIPPVWTIFHYHSSSSFVSVGRAYSPHQFPQTIYLRPEPGPPFHFHCRFLPQERKKHGLRGVVSDIILSLDILQSTFLLPTPHTGLDYSRRGLRLLLIHRRRYHHPRLSPPPSLVLLISKKKAVVARFLKLTHVSKDSPLFLSYSGLLHYTLHT